MLKSNVCLQYARTMGAGVFTVLALLVFAAATCSPSMAQDGNAKRDEAYEQTIWKIIKENWVSPAVAKTKQLTCQVTIEIEPGGKVKKYSITQKSGNKEFDSSVTRAIDKVKELPAPPSPTMLEIEITFQSKGKGAAAAP